VNWRVLCLLSFIFCASSQPVLARPRHLTLKEAEAIALLAIKTTDIGADHFPQFELDHYKDSWFPRFETFDASSDVSPEGGSNIDYIDVDMRTGDVWHSIACDELKNPILHRAQIALRARLGMDQRTYRRLRIPGPFCD
jgi:hypothetical protein